MSLAGWCGPTKAHRQTETASVESEEWWRSERVMYGQVTMSKVSNAEVQCVQWLAWTWMWVWQSKCVKCNKSILQEHKPMV